MFAKLSMWVVELLTLFPHSISPRPPPPLALHHPSQFDNLPVQNIHIPVRYFGSRKRHVQLHNATFPNKGAILYMPHGDECRLGTTVSGRSRFVPTRDMLSLLWAVKCSSLKPVLNGTLHLFFLRLVKTTLPNVTRWFDHRLGMFLFFLHFIILWTLSSGQLINAHAKTQQ